MQIEEASIFDIPDRSNSVIVLPCSTRKTDETKFIRAAKTFMEREGIGKQYFVVPRTRTLFGMNDLLIQIFNPNAYFNILTPPVEPNGPTFPKYFADDYMTLLRSFRIPRQKVYIAPFLVNKNKSDGRDLSMKTFIKTLQEYERALHGPEVILRLKPRGNNARATT